MARPVPLHVVPKLDQPEPSLDYESEQRRHIASRNWGAVHVAGDRAPPLDLAVMRRGWR